MEHKVKLIMHRSSFQRSHRGIWHIVTEWSSSRTWCGIKVNDPWTIAIVPILKKADGTKVPRIENGDVCLNCMRVFRPWVEGRPSVAMLLL